MASIKQNPHPIALPNFRNLGISLRILLLTQAMGGVAALLKAPDLASAWRVFVEFSVLLQPILMASLVVLPLASDALRRLPYRVGIGAVLLLELAITALTYQLMQSVLGTNDLHELPRYTLLSLIATGIVLGYFNLRDRALSPALGEARLQALQARIRPHFLFNSINAVLSLIRSEPRQAERALENLAELFRVLMADNRQLAPLGDEVRLCRQYLELEQLRLGDRLQVAWHVDKMPEEALIPPLLLQPLVENAVYHGIEPSSQPGEVNINIYRNHNQVHLVIRNPYQHDGNHHGGNKMALQNIRERLALHFDAEGQLESTINGNVYQVHITLPYTVSRA
jgi:two-component system, LytTR family, sensor histidine kinase AlgZ